MIASSFYFLVALKECCVIYEFALVKVKHFRKIHIKNTGLVPKILSSRNLTIKITSFFVLLELMLPLGFSGQCRIRSYL